MHLAALPVRKGRLKAQLNVGLYSPGMGQGGWQITALGLRECAHWQGWGALRVHCVASLCLQRKNWFTVQAMSVLST